MEYGETRMKLGKPELETAYVERVEIFPGDVRFFGEERLKQLIENGFMVDSAQSMGNGVYYVLFRFPDAEETEPWRG